MSFVLALVDVGATLEEATGLFQYLLVFLFAAIPVIEILVVIPIGIGVGLHPVTTGAVAFAGNVLSVGLLVVFQRRITTWWLARGDGSPRGGRVGRARRLWDRYGVPALGFGGPVLTGVHVAALVALLAGSRPRTVVAWMTVGIAVWTVILVVASVTTLSLLGIQ